LNAHFGRLKRREHHVSEEFGRRRCGQEQGCAPEIGILL
jgi:hypothetical protein